MHIPDGYLGPATAGTLYAAALPFWYAAGHKLKRLLSGRIVPLMALLSAFCFVIQMINIPLPGGTTGHAVGAGVASIVLGPWPAVLAISITLVIQALFFGDGGITALGANCFNMAIVQVFASYWLYRRFSAFATTPRSKSVAAGFAGYLGLNLAALCAGVELGLQPVLAHAHDGTPLYAPYSLSISVPAMLLGHSVAGIAEAVLTAAAVSYLLRSAPELLETAPATVPLPIFWKRLRTLWLAVAALAIVTPLGLLAPGTAWGEWSTAELKTHGLGFIPEGIRRWEGTWSGWFQDYSVPGLGSGTGYVLSAVLGVIFILAVFGVLTLLGRRAALSQRSSA
jgi:cobalt/nickel transport system permease protein